jgi:hypothetical protein
MNTTSAWLVALLLFNVASAGQETGKVAEQAASKAIKLKVHVYSQGKPVRGLHADDFLVCENDIPKPITLCQERRTALKPGEAAEEYRNPRLYAFIFNLATTGPEIEKALRHIFTWGMRPNDRLIVLSNTFIIRDHEITDTKAEFANCYAMLTRACQSSRGRLLELGNTLTSASNQLLAELNAEKGKIEAEYVGYIDLVHKLNVFKLDYQRYMTEYRQQFLDVLQGPKQAYARLATFLQTRSIETAIVVFNQPCLFPKLSPTSEIARKVRQLAIEAVSQGLDGAQEKYEFDSFLTDIENTYMESGDSVHPGLEQFASMTNLKIHSFLISPADDTNLQLDMLATANLPNFEMLPLGRHIEETLASLSRRTGGIVVKGASPEPLLAEFGYSEDTFYEIFFSPDPAWVNQPTTFRVSSRSSDQVIATSRAEKQAYFQAFATEQRRRNNYLTIDALAVSAERRLEFSLAHFQFAADEARRRGNLVIRIRLQDGQKKVVLDREIAVNPVADGERFSFGLPPELAGGAYTAILDITDLVQKKSISQGFDFAL